jgi:hypothetical protein
MAGVENPRAEVERQINQRTSRSQAVQTTLLGLGLGLSIYGGIQSAYSPEYDQPRLDIVAAALTIGVGGSAERIMAQRRCLRYVRDYKTTSRKWTSREFEQEREDEPKVSISPWRETWNVIRDTAPSLFGLTLAPTGAEVNVTSIVHDAASNTRQLVLDANGGAATLGAAVVLFTLDYGNHSNKFATYNRMLDDIDRDL